MRCLLILLSVLPLLSCTHELDPEIVALEQAVQGGTVDTVHFAVGNKNQSAIKT